MTSKKDNSTFRYWAFISYSHADKRWGEWLHKAIEAYRIPKHLVGQPARNGKIPKRLTPIFRDRDELPTSTDLGNIIDVALKESAYLIVICSKSSAKSHWVNEEILTFQRLGRSDRILCLIVDGRPNATTRIAAKEEECFPPALRHDPGATATHSHHPANPAAADARPNKESKTNCKLKIVAGMLEVGFDELKQRHQQARQRQLLGVTALALFGMLITSALATAFWYAREDAKTEAETARQVSEFLISLFRVSDPSEARGNTITAREILDKGAENIEKDLQDQPKIQITLLDTVGNVYHNIGLFDDAEKLLSKARARAGEIYSSKDAELTKVDHSLAGLYSTVGRHDDAEKLYLSVIERDEMIFGPKHPRIANTFHDLANLYIDLDRVAEAEYLAKDALTIRSGTYGESSVEVASSLHVLARIEREQGKYAEGLRHAKQALSIFEKLLPPDHPRIATAVAEISISYSEQELLEEQEPYALRVLDIDEKVYGADHYLFANSLESVGILFAKQGKFEKAEPYFIRALEATEAAFGPVHDDVGFRYFNLGYLYGDMEQYDKAESNLLRSIEIWTEVFDEYHSNNAWALNGLALNYVKRGKLDDARKAADRALKINEQTYGPEHQNTATSVVQLASIATDEGNYSEALPLYERALAITETKFGPRSSKTADVLAEYLNCLELAGEAVGASMIRERLATLQE